MTVFDLNSTTPAAEYESQDNLLLGAGWGDNGVLYAVGDASLLRARSGELSFSEYSYQGRTPTAFQFAGGQCYLSVSAYEHAGASTPVSYTHLCATAAAYLHLGYPVPGRLRDDGQLTLDGGEA